MKKIAMLLSILFTSACVDEPLDTETTTESVTAPDAGAETAEGRKGGETVPCNCD